MGMSNSISRVMHNPEPLNFVDDILRPDGDAPIVQRCTPARRAWTWIATA
jgi:NADH-quinone oxidoreductase subunit B